VPLSAHSIPTTFTIRHYHGFIFFINQVIKIRPPTMQAF